MVKGILIEEQFDSTNENGQLALFSSHFRKEAIIMKEITTEKLRRFNLIMGGLHLIQGIAMLFLATNVIQKIGEFSPEISQFYLAFNPETRSLETAVFCKTFLHNIAKKKYTPLRLKFFSDYFGLDRAFLSRKLSPVKLKMCA